MKINSIFLFFVSIWSIDFLTTIIALSNGLFEANFIPRFFFNFGFFGFVVFFIVTCFILYLSSLLIFKLSNYNKNPDFIQIIPITVFWVLEVQTILNNINLL